MLCHLPQLINNTAVDSTKFSLKRKESHLDNKRIVSSVKKAQLHFLRRDDHICAPAFFWKTSLCFNLMFVNVAGFSSSGQLDI